MALSGLVPSDVADDRNDSVVDLHRANELKRVFVREIADLATGAISLHHQSSERRIVAAIVAADARIPRVEPLGNERGSIPIDHLAVVRRERHAKASDLVVAQPARGGDRLRIEARIGERRQDLARRSTRPRFDVRRDRLAEQPQQILEPVVRRHEQRLEEQMLEHVVATHVEHERHARANQRDVRKVLVGSDADIDAAANAYLRELAGDLKVGCLVRDDVVGVEVAAAFGEARDDAGERRVDGALRAGNGR